MGQLTVGVTACSMTARHDEGFFVPFGVWWPATTTAQAKAWQFISQNMSPSGK